jgi:hypothetical protein
VLKPLKKDLCIMVLFVSGVVNIRLCGLNSFVYVPLLGFIFPSQRQKFLIIQKSFKNMWCMKFSSNLLRLNLIEGTGHH